MQKLIFILGSLYLLVSCAGPQDPFGARNYIGDNASYPESFEINVDLSLTVQAPRITFEPQQKIYHRAYPLSITVEDPFGIPSDYRIDIFFNGIKLNQQQLKNASKNYSADHKKLELYFSELKLLPSQENDVRVLYYRGAELFHVAQLAEPRCAFKAGRSIASLGLFQDKKNTIQKVQTLAQAQKINPNLIAGLVAQESSFNPQALSWAKAIGLTQVTSVAEKEIFNKNKNLNWPQFSGIDQMNFLELKMKILSGQINQKNEWRLDPHYSLLGGIKYIHYLTDYWSKEHNQQFLQENLIKNFQDEEAMTNLILASYNSGAVNVKRAIVSAQNEWLAEMQAANEYVKKIKSHCQDFTRGI